MKRNCSIPFPHSIQERIDAFQRYLLTQYHSRSQRWIFAHRYVQLIAEEIVRTIGCDQPVVNLEKVAQLLNASIEQSLTLPSFSYGQLTPTKNGFHVKVRAPNWPKLTPRERFTIAHEFGHIFFYSLHAEHPERILPASFLGNAGYARREEGLCDAFASSLLIPESRARELGEKNLGIEKIVSTATRFGVSPEVLIRRVLYDLDCWSTTVFYFVRILCPNPIEPKVQVLRGTDRKRPSEAAPNKDTVARIVRGKLLEDAKTTLSKHPAFTHAEVISYGSSTILARVTV